MTIKAELCTKCNGQGMVVNTQGREEKAVTCPKCKGSGLQ